MDFMESLVPVTFQGKNSEAGFFVFDFYLRCPSLANIIFLVLGRNGYQC